MKSFSSKKKIKKGDVVIISSPSGTGKTTVTKKLIKKIKNSSLSISCTTRPPRNKEVHGKDYFFLSKKKFLSLKKNNKFLESELVFDNYYGTLKSEVFGKKNKTVFLDVDWKGARTLRRKLDNLCFSIFLLPPSIGILKKRLLTRHPENQKIALRRFICAKKDIKHWTEYDFIVVNDNLNQCVNEIYRAIFKVKKDDFQKEKIKKAVNKLLNSKLN